MSEKRREPFRIDLRMGRNNVTIIQMIKNQGGLSYEGKEGITACL